MMEHQYLPATRNQPQHYQPDSSCDERMMNGTVARRMADEIHSEVKRIVQQSRLVRKPEQLSEIILVHAPSDLRVGQLLGSGAFSEVHAVEYYPTFSPSSEPQPPQRYAMKHLKQKLLSQPENFRLAASELAIEAHMLASFHHPNIIRIHGWAQNGVASFTQGRHDSFFLLLDCLEETLDQRIASWHKQEVYRTALCEHHQPTTYALMADLLRSSNATSSSSTLAQQVRLERQAVYLEKLIICTEIASALAYLHSLGVIFRDLKPNNIGFLHGRVKLFDFGLSRELPGRQINLTQPFHMSGKVGTLRYMAPEVAMHAPYNVSSDVYSWAMVCYEVMTLQKPFSGWTRDMHARLVCQGGMRPEMNDANAVPLSLQHLLFASWRHEAPLRPTMTTVYQTMRLFQEQELIAQEAERVVQQQVVAAVAAAAAAHCYSPLPFLSSPTMSACHPYLQQQPHAVVELPRDFAMHKLGGRHNHNNGAASSDTFTRSTMSTSGVGSSLNEVFE